jgi:hypothetical protein
MRIAVSEAKRRLTELIKLAEAGEEVILTRHGQAMVRLGIPPFVIASSRPAAGRPLWTKENRHCEEPLGDEAIQGHGTVLAALDRHAAKRRLAMTD